MTAWSVSDGAESLTCIDLDAGSSIETSLLELRQIVGNQHITSCTDDYALVAKLCGQANMSRLRTLCPMSCACGDTIQPSRDVGDYTGWPASIFASTAFGCPGSCSALRGAVSSSLSESIFFVADFAMGTACADVPVEYLTNPNVDVTTLPLEDEHGAIPYDFNTIFIPRSFHTYISGLFEWLFDTPLFVANVPVISTYFEQAGVIPPATGSELVDFVLSGGFRDSILAGRWELLPGQRHPGNLTGCQFLTSREFDAIINVRLCYVEEIRGLRHICPVSCGCGAMEGCPQACLGS